MTGVKKRVAAGLLLLCLVSASSPSLAGCDVAEEVPHVAGEAVSQLFEGDVIGEVGTEYVTKWFSFTVASLEVTQSYGTYTAAESNTLVVAHIIETNTSGASLPFGTYDWFVADDLLTERIFPLDAFTDEMMPSSFTLSDGKTGEYDVVIEYSTSLADPFLIYIEAGAQGSTYSTFKIPLS